jgi:hypothetical protein
MINLIVAFTSIFLSIFKSKKFLICEIALLKKDVEILKRKKKKRTLTNHFDRLFFVILNKIANIKDHISIVKPETVLRWQRFIIKKFWTYKSSGKKKGRKATSKDIQDLILSIKNDNILWGVEKIQGELLKLDIHLDTKTIWNILRTFRRRGMVKKYMNWKKFLSMHIDSIFSMDFFTIDTIFNKRYYFFLSSVIKHEK